MQQEINQVKNKRVSFDPVPILALREEGQPSSEQLGMIPEKPNNNGPRQGEGEKEFFVRPLDGGRELGHGLKKLVKR